MTHRRISLPHLIFAVAVLTICSLRCTNAAEHDEEAAGSIFDPTAADDAASDHSSLRKRDLGLGNGVDPNGLGSIFGNQGQGPPQDVPSQRRGPPMSKADREAAITDRKQKIKEAIAAMKASKIKNLGRVQPTQDELDQIAAPTPVGEPKLLGFSRTIDDVEDTTLFDTESGTVTKCVTSEVDGGIRLLLSAVSSTTVQVFNPDIPDGAHIFTVTVNANDVSWTNTVRTEVGDRVCIQATSTSHVPTIKEAAYVILGDSADRRELTHEAGHCSYNAECIEQAGTPTAHDCGGHSHSSAVDDARDGVAGIIFQTSSGTYGCSGGLINGGIDDDLFLTAYHCISTPSEASSIDFYFFEYDECGICSGGFYNGVNPSQVGAVIMNTYSATDATLLRLKGIAPQGAVSLGYSTSPVANLQGTNLYRISHPALGHQAYSEGKVDTGRPQCQGLSRGNIIYSSDTYGATEGGSSGSPVVNSLGQIVGQLYGACGSSPSDVCNKMTNSPYLSDYDDATIDGALAVSYASAFEPWLAIPATCKADGQSGCGSNTPCCSGMGNCSGGRNYNRRKCLAWAHESPTPTPAPGPDPAPGGMCSAAGSYPPDDDCEKCCSKACHTNRNKLGQCK